MTSNVSYEVPDTVLGLVHSSLVALRATEASLLPCEVGWPRLQFHVRETAIPHDARSSARTRTAPNARDGRTLQAV